MNFPLLFGISEQLWAVMCPSLELCFVLLLLGITQLDELGRTVALRGRFKKSGIKFFSERSLKVYDWASLELDYCGG